MKYVISLFLCLNAFAAPIQLFHEGGAEYAEGLKIGLMQDYFIPEDLIMIVKIKDCSEVIRSGKLDLCLKNNGDLLMVSVDREFVSESLKIFRAP